MTFRALGMNRLGCLIQGNRMGWSFWGSFQFSFPAHRSSKRRDPHKWMPSSKHGLPSPSVEEVVEELLLPGVLEQGCGIKGFLPTSVSGIPLSTNKIVVVSQKWIPFPTALVCPVRSRGRQLVSFESSGNHQNGRQPPGSAGDAKPWAIARASRRPALTPPKGGAVTGLLG